MTTTDTEPQPYWADIPGVTDKPVLVELQREPGPLSETGWRRISLMRETGGQLGDGECGPYGYNALYQYGETNLRAETYTAITWIDTHEPAERDFECGVEQVTFTFRVDEDGEVMDDGSDYEYENLGYLIRHARDEQGVRDVVAELDRHGLQDISWAFTDQVGNL